MNVNNNNNAMYSQQMQSIMQNMNLTPQELVQLMRQNPQAIQQHMAAQNAANPMAQPQQQQMPHLQGAPFAGGAGGVGVQHSPTNNFFPGQNVMNTMVGGLQGSPTHPTGFNPSIPGSAVFPNMNTDMAKQMAALNEMGANRMRQSTGGGGSVPSRPLTGTAPGQQVPSQMPMQQQQMNPNAVHMPLPGGVSGQPQQPLSTAQQQQLAQIHNRQQNENFLRSMAWIHAQGEEPLPAALTGVPIPSYDPVESRWKHLEIGQRPGLVKVEGKELDLFQLSTFVVRAGGYAVVNERQQWQKLAELLGLPSIKPASDPSKSPMAMGVFLRAFYEALCLPIEQSRLEQQRRHMMQRQQQQQQMAQQLQAAGGAAVVPGVNGNGALPAQGAGMQMTQAQLQQMQARQAAGAGAVMGGGDNQPQTQTSPTLPSNFTLNMPSHLQQQPQQTPGRISSPTKPSLSRNASLAQSNLGAVGATSGDSGDKKRKREDGEADADAEGAERLGKKLKNGDTPAPGSEDWGSRPETATSATGQQIPGMPGSGTNTHPPSGVPALDGAPAELLDPAQATLEGAVVPPAPDAQRKKIEYVPWRKDFEGYGGRNLNEIDIALANTKGKRGLRNMNDLGTIDIEGLTMSIRSRLGVEISYALTVLAFLSMLEKNPTLPHGFLLRECEDLGPVLLDLLEDLAFPECEDETDDIFNKRATAAVATGGKIWTHHELTRAVAEVDMLPLPDDPKSGFDRRDRDPLSRPFEVIIATLNILFNLSHFHENQAYMTSNPRFIDFFVKLCAFADEATMRPLSPILGLPELVEVRKQVLHIVANIGTEIRLSSRPVATSHGLFCLLNSFIIDPLHATSHAKTAIPVVHPKQLPNGQIQPEYAFKPPVTADHALEALSRVLHADENRKVVSSFPTAQLWNLFDALVHMMPLTDQDFMMYRTIFFNDWVAHAERISLCVYSLAFLAPPSLKSRMRREPGHKQVLHRLVEKTLTAQPLWDKNPWNCLCRRTAETLGIINDPRDSFTASKHVPFGLRDDDGEKSDRQTGPGLFPGDEFLWLLMKVKDADKEILAEVEKWSAAG